MALFVLGHLGAGGACTPHSRCMSWPGKGGTGAYELPQRAFPSAPFGNSAKGPPEWGLWAVTLGTTALCWGCCSCLGVILHSPLCLKGHPEQGGGGEVGRGTEFWGAARCKT